MNNSLGMRHSAMRSDARKFLKPADVPHGMKWGEVEPQFFALVDKKLKFVTTKHNQVVVFSSREAANEACKQQHRHGPREVGEVSAQLLIHPRPKLLRCSPAGAADTAPAVAPCHQCILSSLILVL
eukprot:TRINITY_DN4092_c0_g1_i4.p1 TRINITY_DN4092_c0_g1~~TRINITY_DN4092_c0_g1_i4.p1  ORF type:complete len:126 (+),score=8.53 TRINITY_DN4092_c0_g1_i4:445-822(+)